MLAFMQEIEEEVSEQHIHNFNNRLTETVLKNTPKTEISFYTQNFHHL